MAILQILYFPDERLRKIAKPVKEINEETISIINNMLDTMYHEDGIGLAATQVNIHQQIIVINISGNHKDYLVLINPKLIEKHGKVVSEEGCLSIPGQRAQISRAEKIKICALDIYNKSFNLKANGLLAICIQHEIDHLFGKLFIDYLSPSEQQIICQKLKSRKFYINT